MLGDPASLPRWWPSVYLEVRVLAAGDALGVGKTVELLTQGWLPYRLRWRFVTIEMRPDGFVLEATEDFEGRGVWRFVQVGDSVNVTYDWRIRARKPLLRSLSWRLKPVCAANHRWAMASARSPVIPTAPPSRRVPIPSPAEDSRQAWSVG